MNTAILGARKARTTALAIALAAVLSVIFAGVAYATLVQGNSHDNNLTGTETRDVIRGMAGDDTIKGLGGTDDINGGVGGDTIYGGDGEDFLRGHQGDDTIYAGDDKLSDEVRCGAGYDVAYLSGKDHSSNNITGCEEKRSQ
jgi:Ca2+-binding RTX toxin-like protein